MLSVDRNLNEQIVSDLRNTCRLRCDALFLLATASAAWSCDILDTADWRRFFLDADRRFRR